MSVNIPIPKSVIELKPGSYAYDAYRVGIESDAGAQPLCPNVNQQEEDDESVYVDKSASFSKGVRQRGPGLVDLDAFANFRNRLDAERGFPRNDPHGYVAPRPPKVVSAAYAAELIELYWASLLRDVPFTAYEWNATAIAAARELDWLGDAYCGPRDERGRVTSKTLFRGGLGRAGVEIFPGETSGPYVSQFLLQPTRMGAQPIDQKFQTSRAGVDYLTDEEDWHWAQHGVRPIDRLQSDAVRRYLKDGRGLTAYTRSDEPFQAYFVAHLILSAVGVGYNPGSPFFNGSTASRGGFGGCDITGALAAVARAACTAAGHQAWDSHLRHRPESGGGLVHLANTHRADRILQRADDRADSLHESVLSSPAIKLSYMRHGTYLLPQAYPEGAPACPSYPSGHGAVAGACVTALKFFYDCERPIVSYMPVLEATGDGLSLAPYAGIDAQNLTFSSELSKLGHNVSFGNGLHAGIHWRSDVDEAMLLGESVAIGYLREQARDSQVRFSVRIRKFDGEFETIGNIN